MKIFVALCLLVATVHADNVEAVLIPHNDPKTPTIEVALINAPQASKMTLTSGAITINASKMRAYPQTTDSIAVAFVIQGDNTWATAELAPIGKAFDALDMAKMCPPDSFGMVVSYATDTQIQVAMGPLARIKSKNLGAAKDYKARKGAQLAPAVTLALSEVAKIEAPRKAVIIVGDGSDSDPKSPLADLKKQAAAQNIELYAIATKTGAITNLVPTPVIANKAADVGTQIGKLFKHLTDRTYITFIIPKSIPFDGKAHDFVVTLDKLALDKQTVTLK